jgi:hypothetical protein
MSLEGARAEAARLMELAKQTQNPEDQEAAREAAENMDRIERDQAENG